MAWGTVHQKGANVVWYGDLMVQEISETVRTGLFSSQKIIKGYRYYLGAQVALCQGEIDELIEIRHDGKKPTQTVSVVGDDEYKITVDDKDLFGGEDREGGVSGTINVYRGTATQTPNDYMQAVLETPLPAYRMTAYAVFRQYYWGNSNYIKPISWVFRRTPAAIPGMNPAHANISGDANPAVMLYEIMTNPLSQLALPAAQINSATFAQVAATLYAEGLGMSYLLESPSQAGDLVRDILRHIDGVCYTDPATGLITLALARADYDPASLPVFDIDNVTTCELTRIGWDDTKNIIKLTYIDRAENFTERVCQHQDLGNIQARGGEIAAETIDYKGVSNATVAALLAARAIKSLSYPLANVHLTCNRDAWALRPGSCFLFTWAPLGIANSIYRVTRINYGSLLEGMIDLDAVEDVFAVSGDAFAPPGASTWVDPNQSPGPCQEQALFELPYQAMGGLEKRFVAALAGRDTGQEYKAEIWTDPAGGSDYLKTGEIPAFAPYGYLTVALEHITEASVTVHLRAGKDLTTLADATDAEHQQGKNILLIGDEFFAWKTISANGDGTYSVGTCWRGVLDTVPEAHAAGSPVLFLSAGVGTTAETEYPADCTVNVKILPKTFGETLAIADAAAVSITTASRAWKPLPPGRIRLNGTRSWDTITGDATVTWADRNKVAQTAAQRVYSQDEPDISGGPQGNYTVETLVDGVVVHTDTGVTAKTHTYPAATREADSADGLAPVVLRVSGAYNSFQSVANSTDPCIMTGAGMTLGMYLGGIDQ